MAILNPSTTLEQNGDFRTMAISLSDLPEDEQVIIDILSNKLYSDKQMALIREYSVNSVDAHVDAGIPNTPIEVTLPTVITPELRIRDFGDGLNMEEVATIYTKYGRSTKRGTNNGTGQLGLGCKAAFSYGDNFIVISRKDKKKWTYNLTKNGVCTLLSEEEMGIDDKTGMEIVIPVKSMEEYIFQDKAVDFFKYWKIQPVIKGLDESYKNKLEKELTDKPIFEGINWNIKPSISYYDRKGVAVMGNVPYPIEWDNILKEIKEESRIVFDFIKQNNTTIYFNIGDLDFSASRESLEYTEKTNKKIIESIHTIIDEIFIVLDKKIKESSTYWEALLTYNKVFGNDDDRIFKGDIQKLEKVYKGKFTWNNIPIEDGYFNKINYWDTQNGYSENGEWKTLHNPVLQTFYKKNERIKLYSPGYNSRGSSIPASNKIKIIIDNCSKKLTPKTVVKYIYTTSSNISKVYYLKFKDNDQLKHFIDTIHFESVPVTYTSDIFDNFKTWLKRNRAVRVSNNNYGVILNNNSSIKTQTVKCFVPHKNASDSFDYQDVNIYNKSGVYVKIDKDEIIINHTHKKLEFVSHHTFTLLNSIGETLNVVYAFSEKTLTSKWFEKAKNEGHWIKLEDYLKNREDQIIYGKGQLIADSHKYYEYGGFDRLGISFLKKIQPLLTNKTGLMYTLCRRILSGSYNKYNELAQAIIFFNITELNSQIDFNKIFDDINIKYPMIKLLNNRSVASQDNYDEWRFPDKNIEIIASYVNDIDQ